MANTVTTTTQNTPWAAPYLQNFWGGAFDLANRPYQQYQGPQVAGLSDLQTNALSGINSAMYGNPTTWGAQNFLGNVMQNGGNPFLQQAIDTTTSDASRAFDSKLGELNQIFSNPNSFGSDRHAVQAGLLSQDFGRGLGQAIGNLQLGQYNTGLDRAMGAANQAQGASSNQFQQMMQALQAGAVPQQNLQAMYNQGQQNWNNWWNYPMQQQQGLQSALGLGGNAMNQSVTSPGPNLGSQIFGGGILAAQGLQGLGAFGNNGWLSGMFGGSGGLPNYGGGMFAYGDGMGPW